jgi:predicted ATPase
VAELVIVTGGACSGKTSLVNELAARGFETTTEAAYEVIAELTRVHGLAEQARWRSANQVEFQREVTRRQHAREVTARRSAAPLVFCDRGVLDGQAYCEVAGVQWPDDLHALARPARYAHVFLLQTLSVFDPRPETGRIDSHDESVRVASLLEALYRPRTTALTRLPEQPIADRADLVLRALGLAD